jgi:hypothetical protein
MKQGTNQILGIRIKDGLENVDEILFKFVQGNKAIVFKYPSENTALDSAETDVIDLYWTYKDTYMFEAGKPIYLDTLIKMKGTQTTPEVPIKELIMSPTLFRQIEVGEFVD